MHLNHFLPSPQYRKAETGTAPAGAYHRPLGRLGSTWHHAPVRRLIQVVALCLFLALLFYVCWPHGSLEFAKTREARELIDAESFLALDPLVSLSTALATGTWVWSLTWAGVLLMACLIFPRGFCGSLCPLGTLIDVFDWALGRRVRRLHLKRRGRWVHVKYYLLSGVLVAAVLGVLLSGFVAAIPVVTRGLTYTLGGLQTGLLRGWISVPPLNAGQYVSIALFLAVFCLGFLGPRFWCRYVCPSGAVFSVASHLRITNRKVEATCVKCSRCVQVCPFDAIKDDFTTRTADCTFCQTCGGACPVGAISFVGRWNGANAKPKDDPPTHERPLSRRGFLGGTAAGLALVLGTDTILGARLLGDGAYLPVRPPGSVPEDQFLRTCIRCGNCIKACPTNVLQPMGFQQRLEGLWTPRVAADWAGCEPTCNNCGQVCPTGAIRALSLEKKRTIRMGLAEVNLETCLPHAGRQECDLCVQACGLAGYNAIEYRRVRIELDETGMPLEDSGLLAPAVLADKCVGCGLCQTRCYSVNVDDQDLLAASAIQVIAGPEADRKRREAERQKQSEQQDGGEFEFPDFFD